jgi:predicted Rossmann fold nucleotide-binding protein DprA/Smf involved in DNA uptake
VIAAQTSDDTLATALLCAGLGGARGAAAPLTHAEWNGLARALLRANWRPGDLLRWGVDAARGALPIDAATADRLGALLGQAVTVAAELERLAQAGIRVLSRADERYPSRWRTRLREQGPPLLFVAGPVSLLERGGIAAVGSREVDAGGATFARAVGEAAARGKTPLISGGARGVDREAMFGALDAGGEAVGILADGLSRTLRAPEVRRMVADEQLVLLSPHRPDARFEIWRAMGRNKLIYALADVAIVISSDAERGGTWAGATENLRHDWSPLFVRNGEDIPDGNRRLLELGALPLDDLDLESADGHEILASLLSRAAAQSGAGALGTVQSPLLADLDGRPSRPGNPIGNGQPDGPDKRLTGPDTNQLAFGEGF